MKEEEYIERVDAYLAKKLSAIEREQFEKDLESDSDLKQVYDTTKLARDVVNHQAEVELRERFTEWRSEKDGSKMKYVWMSIAASVLAVVISYFALFKNDALNSRELAVSHYTLPSLPERTMGGDDKLWSAGIDEFADGKYEVAIKDWEQVDLSNPERQYYLAHAYFNTAQYEKAISKFQPLASGNSAYGFAAEWYLALSYLASGQQEEFNKSLDVLIQHTDHPYYQDAMGLRKALQK